MDFRRGTGFVAGPALAGCGIAGTFAWQQGMWGLLTGAALVAAALSVARVPGGGRPRAAAQRRAVAQAEADATVLRALLDAAPTPLVELDGAAAARTLNRAARRLFATDDRILPLPADLSDPAVARLRHEGRSWRVDRVVLADGRAVAALIDIEQEERAAEARVTVELIEVLGHELLNGLAPIVSLAESGAAMVERPGVDRDLLREILGTLARRAEGLQRFTEAYRALARLPPPTLRRVDLGEMAADLARLFAGRWPATGLSVAVEVADWVLDRDQIHQALWALLQNAAEAAGDAHPSGGSVALRLHRVAAGLACAVEDDGGGVAPGAADRIFRPFHTTKVDGTGIGLSLARQIALAHGGALTLERGATTVFRLTLP